MSRICSLVFCLAALNLSAQQPNDAFRPIRLYNGNWAVAMHDQGKTHTDHLVNRCSLIGEYYACQQTVNGKVSALVVFVPAGPNHYFVNSLLPTGRVTGRTDLTVTGSHWVYGGDKEDDGHWYRTINDFTGTKKIHFEMQTSTDGKTWTTTRSGDEVHEP